MLLLEGRVSGPHAWTPPEQWSIRVSGPMLRASGRYPALSLRVMAGGGREMAAHGGRPVFNGVGESDPWAFNGPIPGR